MLYTKYIDNFIQYYQNKIIIYIIYKYAFKVNKDIFKYVFAYEFKNRYFLIHIFHFNENVFTL
jgi:hypothetical protein